MLLFYGAFLLIIPPPGGGGVNKDRLTVGPFFFTLNYPSTGEDNRKKDRRTAVFSITLSGF